MEASCSLSFSTILLKMRLLIIAKVLRLHLIFSVYKGPISLLLILYATLQTREMWDPFIQNDFMTSH